MTERSGMGLRITELRDELGLSQEELAERARKHLPPGYPKKIHTVTIQRLEVGATRNTREEGVDVVILWCVATALGRSLADLSKEVDERGRQIAAVIGATSNWRGGLDPARPVGFPSAA